MEIFIRKKKSLIPLKISALLFFFILPFIGSAQTEPPPTINSKLTGEVIDARTKQPIPGAVVKINGTTHAVATDNKGQFNFITGQKFPYTLLISFVGYKTQEFVADGSPVTIQLVEDITQLNDVVVVAYGSEERRNIIGSVTKTNLEDVKNIPGGSFESQLQGKIPGVQITSGSGGIPGEASTVHLRGVTGINGNDNPLYVIDGVFVSNSSMQTFDTGGHSTSPLADINPNDIESISVLKDAEATVLYGVRGANGVIIVTTKRGKYNQKPKVDFSVSSGFARVVKLWDLTTGPEHAELVNENYLNTGGVYAGRPFRPVTEIYNGQPGRGLPEEQQTYNRLDQVFRTAGLQNYNASITGGNEGTKYYISAGYDNEESTLAPITFSRTSVKANFDQKVTDKITIGVSNTFGRTYRNEARAGDGPAGGLLQAALHTPTYLSPYNDQGVLVGRAGFDNVQLLLENYDVNSTSLRYTGNFYGDAEIIPGLKFHTSFGLDYNDYPESQYWDSFLISGAAPAGSSPGSATSSIGQRASLLNEQTLSYSFKAGPKNGFNILVGNTFQSDISSSTSATGTGFANNSYKLLPSASVTTGSQSWSRRNLESFFSKVNYNYDGKYLLDFSLRADGSSAFGAHKQWGYFPGVGAAWQVKEEPFLKDVEAINDLKIRVSYGITGSQNGAGDFASLGLWSGGSSYEGNPGTAPQQIANKDLGWESTSQFNAGFDLSVLKDRLAITFDYYRKYTSNGIISSPLAATTGFSSYTTNQLEVSNRGYEIGINSTNVKTKDFTWTTNFNISGNVNKIEKLANPVKFGSRDLQWDVQGSPLYSFYLYKELGVDPQTGNVIYDDKDKSGTITAADRQIDGSIWPKFFGGLSNAFTYKSFDLSALFGYSYGNKVYNLNRFFGEGGGARDAARVIFASNLARWQKPGDITSVPKPDGINNNNYKDDGSRWLEDGSFIRLRTLTLGYTLPTVLTQKVKLNKVRFAIIASNLFLITKYTGLDPETSSSSSQNAQGIDLGTPPQPRSFQFSVNVSL